ncbi:MAG: hypothetical protein QM220_03960, partial [Atribacterota bacterium]|nr:hypothetical protein [Atribacterota bacterium]
MANKDEKQSNIKKRILGIILILIAFYYLSALLFFPNWFFFSSVIIDLINRTVGIGKYLLFFLILIEGLIL